MASVSFYSGAVGAHAFRFLARVGDLLLPNRILMAPLTRQRCGTTRVPNALMAKYYEQRASAGLILTEATSVTPMGVGCADTPGIWSREQVEGWKKNVTKAVHDASGLHLAAALALPGRISHPMFLNGATPVAPSAIRPKGSLSLVRPETDYVMPRALERAEVAGVIDAYELGARMVACGIRRRGAAVRTAISSISSSRTAPITERMNTAGRSMR